MNYYLTQEGVNFLNETRSAESRLRMILKKKIRKGGAGGGARSPGRLNVGIRGGHPPISPDSDAIGTAFATYDAAATHSLQRLGGGGSVKTHKDPWVRMSATADPHLRTDTSKQFKEPRAKRRFGRPSKVPNPHKPGTAEHAAQEKNIEDYEQKVMDIGTGRGSDFEGRSKTQTPFFDKEAKERIAGGVKVVKKSRLLRSVRDAQPHSRRNR